MSSQYEQKENRVAHLNIEVPAEEFQKSLKFAFNKSKRFFEIPGFRKGKAPYQIVVNHYGETILYDDALDDAFPKAFEAAIEEHELTPYSQPRIKLEDIGSKVGLKLDIEFALKPEVELGEYKGLEAYRPAVDVTEEDVDVKLEEARQRLARQIPVEGRSLENGDTVTIDYVGKKDDVAFQGGTANDFDLELGSNTFIPGFEEGIVGHEVGDEFDLDLTFPEEYQAEDLAGQDVVFEVKVKAATYTELPDIDDEFVKDVSEKSDTVEEYRQELRKELEDVSNKQADRVYEQNLVELITEDSDVTYSDYIIEDEIERQLNMQRQQFQMYGINYDDFLSYSGKTLDSVREEMKPDTRKKIEMAYTLDKLDQALELDVSEDELEDFIAEQAEENSLTVEAFKDKYMKEERDKENLEFQIRRIKLFDLLHEWNNSTDVKPEAEDNEEVETEEAEEEEKEEKETEEE